MTEGKGSGFQALGILVVSWEWLAGVGFGRCGLVARVPQDRMPSRSDTWNGRDRKAYSREQLIKLKADGIGGPWGNRSYRTDGSYGAYREVSKLVAPWP